MSWCLCKFQHMNFSKASLVRALEGAEGAEAGSGAGGRLSTGGDFWEGKSFNRGKTPYQRFSVVYFVHYCDHRHNS